MDQRCLQGEFFYSLSYHKSNLFQVNANLTLVGSPLANLAGVYGYNGILFGVNGKYDLSANELKNTSVAFGYEQPNYTIHSYTSEFISQQS
jgi:hypothetical protein